MDGVIDMYSFTVLRLRVRGQVGKELASLALASKALAPLFSLPLLPLPPPLSPLFSSYVFCLIFIFSYMCVHV